MHARGTARHREISLPATSTNFRELNSSSPASPLVAYLRSALLALRRLVNCHLNKDGTLMRWSSQCGGLLIFKLCAMDRA